MAAVHNFTGKAPDKSCRYILRRQLQGAIGCDRFSTRVNSVRAVLSFVTTEGYARRHVLGNVMIQAGPEEMKRMKWTWFGPVA